jgi:hypothetical protein
MWPCLNPAGLDGRTDAIYRIGRDTAELVQTLLFPAPPSEIQPGFAFGTNVAPVPPHGVPEIVAQVDLWSWTAMLPEDVEDGTTKFN